MRRSFNRIARDERGNVATLTAFALFPLLVLLAGVINFGVVFTMRNELQTTADAAALAGASKLGNTQNVLDKANEFAENNMPADGNGDVLADEDIEIGYWDNANRTFTAGGTPENAVRATTRRTNATNNGIATFLGAFIGIDHWDVSTAAIAAEKVNGQGCFLALDPAVAGAFTMSGNSTLTLTGCGVMSNSNNAQSFVTGGSSSATMTCANAAGGISIQKLNGLTLTECGTTLPNQDPVPDPFANVPERSANSCINLPNGLGAQTLTARCYNAGDLKGTKTLAPNGSDPVFVIKGPGSFRINSGANISGNGITIYLTNGATMDWNGNATIHLTAPTSGDYKGILVYGDPDNAYQANNPSKLNGTADSTLTGAIYFPNQAIQYLGNFSGNNACIRVVARTIDFRGNATISATCSALAGIPFNKTLALVD